MASTDEVGIGAALAATFAQGLRDGDRNHREAAASKMAPRLREAFAAARGGDGEGREPAAILRAMTKVVRPAPRTDAPLGDRSRALLSPRVDRSIGREWLGAAPAPRRGYRPPRALVEALARATHAYAYATDSDDRGRGRALHAERIRRGTSAREEPLVAGVEADEAAAILALAAHDDDGARVPPPALLLAASSEPGCPVLALGALARGAAGGPDGDPLGRAGRELSELGLTPQATWRG